MDIKRRNLTHAQAFVVCSILKEHESEYSTMKLETVAAAVQTLAGFPVSPCSVRTLADELGLNIANPQARKPAPGCGQDEFNAAIIELIRAVVNVTVKTEPHRDMLMKHIREMEELT